MLRKVAELRKWTDIPLSESFPLSAHNIHILKLIAAVAFPVNPPVSSYDSASLFLVHRLCLLAFSLCMGNSNSIQKVWATSQEDAR